MVSWPCTSLTYGGPQPRASSPAPGRSILITSAPRSASVWVATGPASTRVRSSTRMPLNGAAIVHSSFTSCIRSNRDEGRGTRDEQSLGHRFQQLPFTHSPFTPSPLFFVPRPSSLAPFSKLIRSGARHLHHRPPLLHFYPYQLREISLSAALRFESRLDQSRLRLRVVEDRKSTRL